MAEGTVDLDIGSTWDAARIQRRLPMTLRIAFAGFDLESGGRVLDALDHDREDMLRVEIDLAEVARCFTGIRADRAPALHAKYPTP